MTNYSLNKIKSIQSNQSTKTYVEKPCRIVKVHSPYMVDVEYFDNNKSDVLYKVPVNHLQTSKAFVFLTLRVGDRGTLRFLDNDVQNYMQGNGVESTEIRKHSVNDGMFCLGFYPNPEQYVLPEGDVSVGNTEGTVITVSGNKIKIYGENITIEGEDLKIEESNVSIIGGDTSVSGGKVELTTSEVSISSGTVDITGGAVSISGNTQIDGRNFMQHVHRDKGSSANVPFTGGVI